MTSVPLSVNWPAFLDAKPIVDVTKDTSATATTSKKSADWKRNFAFLVYGSLYQGVTQEFIYNHAYPVSLTLNGVSCFVRVARN